MPQFGGASEKCNVCSKTVYLAEKIVVEDKEDRKTFHKNCLKCSHCKVVLTLGNYASMQGIFYCKPHFKQLFATKGNYDEGFGKDKHTKNWTPQSLSAPATFVPVDKDEGGSSAAAGSKKETPSNITSKFGRTTLNTEKCHVCSKTVYATEKIVVEEKEGKKVFHKTCLKCSHCNVIVTLGNFASMQGVVYCKPHFKQLFTAKGNYDEGFGKEKASSKWEPQANAAPATFVPVDKDDGPKEKRATPENVASRFKGASTNTEKCTGCGKTVYATERIVVEDKEDRQTFHKSCLRCSHCQVVLTLGNYASLQGVMYCKPHFRQLFAAKGNYDEGFGKEKHTKKWTDRDSETGSLPDEHQKDRERELEQEIGTEREKEGRDKEEREEADKEEAKKRREEQEKLENEEREQEEKEEREREQQELEERKRLEREEEEKEREQSKHEESHDHGESHNHAESHDHKEHHHDHGVSHDHKEHDHDHKEHDHDHKEHDHDHKEHDHDHGVSHDHKEHDHEESHAHKESHDHGESHTHEPHVHEEPKEEQKEEEQKKEEKEDSKEELSHDHDSHDHKEAKESSEPAEKDDTDQ